MTDLEKLVELLLKKSVMFGDFTLASGAKSDFYVDCRLTTMDAEGAHLIGRLGWQAIIAALPQLQAQPTAVGGLTMGADPVALAIAMASASQPHAGLGLLHAFSVRKAPKSHGRTKLIEGNFTEGQVVVVVEDVITSGGSALQAIDSVEKEGGKVALVVSLVDREEGGRAAIEARGVPVVALTTKAALRASHSA
jgi:orotate phosphoribosyltransferase